MEEGCGETIYVVGMGSGERYIKPLSKFQGYCSVNY